MRGLLLTRRTAEWR